MRQKSSATLVVAVAGALFASALTLADTAEAQRRPDARRPAPPPAEPSIDPRADKSRGEEWQIEQRRRWWIESRGLDRNRDAARQRKAAVRTLRAQIEQRAKSATVAAASWRELGPSSMRMGNWTMGRVSGRINAIATHPTNDSVVYIGSASGGVWKTVDAGINWTPTFVDVGSQSIGAIHVESGNPQNVWAGTGDRFDGDCSGYLSDGIFFSSDSGATWSPRNTGMALSTVTSLLTLPTNADIVLAAGFGDRCNQGGDANGGVYRSIDKGQTWTQVASMDRKVEDIVAVPGTSTLYASAPGSGVYRSTDGGAN